MWTAHEVCVKEQVCVCDVREVEKAALGVTEGLAAWHPHATVDDHRRCRQRRENMCHRVLRLCVPFLNAGITQSKINKSAFVCILLTTLEGSLYLLF